MSSTSLANRVKISGVWVCLFLTTAVLMLLVRHLPAPKAEGRDAALHFFTLVFALHLELPSPRFKGTQHK